MIKTLLRSVLCFWAAVLLLALMVCAVEVGCRTWSLLASIQSKDQPFQVADLVIPSASSWLEVRPLMDVNYVNSLGVDVHIRTNEYGLRGGSIEVPKPPGVYRVLCLGGAGVFGADQPEEYTLPATLQRSLQELTGSPVEVINAALPHSGPLMQTLQYRSKLSKFQADLVILFVSIDDLVHDADVRGALRVDKNRQPAYAAHPAAVRSKLNMAEDAKRDFLSLSWTVDWFCDLFTPRDSRVESMMMEGGYGKRELGVIAPLQQMVESQNALFIVSTIPTAWGIEQTKASAAHQRPNFGDEITNVLTELQLRERVPVHNVLTGFTQLPDPRAAFSGQDGCLTAEGNDLYARVFSNYLTQGVRELAQRQQDYVERHQRVVPVSDQRFVPTSETIPQNMSSPTVIR